MTKQPITKHNGLKWILLLSCLGINIYFWFLEGSEDELNVYFFGAFFTVVVLILGIYLSLKDSQDNSRINYGILILILINLLLTGFNVFILILAWGMSGPSGF